MKRRRFLRALIFSLAAVVAATAWANWQVTLAGESRIYRDARAVSPRRVGIVLGTSPGSRSHPNVFFERRLDAAAALYEAGKVHCLLVSGDHGTRYYNEVEAMRRGLVRRGVPNEKIALDHAGFRTLDSVVRARRVFGVTNAVFVTDGFHLPRTLYLARENGIDAVGLSSVPVSTSIAPWPATREIGARALLFLDLYVLHRSPRFLGRREPLPLYSASQT